MKHIFFLLMTFLTGLVRGQDLVSSNTAVESCLDQSDCITTKSGTLLFYDETKNELVLKVDFGQFRLPGDTTDNWINEISDTLLYYKAILNKEDFPVLSNQNSKTMRLNGKIYYNGIWKEQPVELSVYPTENSIVPGNSTGSKYDNVKVNFNLPFVPKDFKAYKKLYYNNQTVDIAVTLGRINLLKPGMEYHLKDIYLQSPR